MGNGSTSPNHPSISIGKQKPFPDTMSALDSDAGTGGGPAEPRPCPSINGTPAGGFACKAGFSGGPLKKESFS